MSHVAVTSIRFSPVGGDMLASASTDRTVRTWNVREGRMLAKSAAHSAYVNAIAWSPDGELPTQLGGKEAIAALSEAACRMSHVACRMSCVACRARFPDEEALVCR